MLLIADNTLHLYTKVLPHDTHFNTPTQVMNLQLHDEEDTIQVKSYIKFSADNNRPYNMFRSIVN